ncbi:MAG: nickel pincer cofactor biosynthesis protein LarB [Pseudomonadota bacterium]
MEKLFTLLDRYRKGKVPRGDVVDFIKQLHYEKIGTATFDSHREVRTGMKEIIYAPGKTGSQLEQLVRRSIRNHESALVTRIDKKAAAALKRKFPGGMYHERGRIFSHTKKASAGKRGKTIAVVTAGAADENVAEEAALVLEHTGWAVERIYDVGVAGIHRVLEHAGRLEKMSAIIVVAGMEGALASVVAGLTSKPVVAVPTSAGYGASFNGIAPLLTMLNSCAGGVAVVNIDSGFKAACVAHRFCMTN